MSVNFRLLSIQFNFQPPPHTHCHDILEVISLMGWGGGNQSRGDPNKRKQKVIPTHCDS